MHSDDIVADGWGEKYQRVRPQYERLADEVRFALERGLNSLGIHAVGLSGRAKTKDSFVEKARRKDYQNPLVETEDLAGVRVVCMYEAELEPVADWVQETFTNVEVEDKASALGADRMGYRGVHCTAELGDRFSGARYDGLVGLRFEIQIRTVLQDAWALISQNVVYKNTAAVPKPLRRDLNNVMSLLEIAQGVFDSVQEKQTQYRKEISILQAGSDEFLAQKLDHETLAAYTLWRFSGLPISDNLQALLLADLNLAAYPTLREIDVAVSRAEPAVNAYNADNPDWFNFGTDFITKSLGFVDQEFRREHGFAKRTLDAFEKYQTLVGTG